MHMNAAEWKRFTIVWAAGWDAQRRQPSGAEEDVGWADTLEEAQQGVGMLLAAVGKERAGGVLAVLHTPTRLYAGGLAFARRGAVAV